MISNLFVMNRFGAKHAANITVKVTIRADCSADCDLFRVLRLHLHHFDLFDMAVFCEHVGLIHIICHIKLL